MTKSDLIFTVYMLGLFILGLILFGHNAFAMPEQTTIDVYAGYAERYGWPIAAIAGSPILSWRLVQWFKLAYKSVKNEKPNWIILDMCGFSIVFGLTYWAWSIYSENALYVAVAVSILHTGIVKAIFKYAPAPVVTILAYGAPEDKTMFTLFAGKDRRSKPRDDDSDDITQRNA